MLRSRDLEVGIRDYQSWVSAVAAFALTVPVTRTVAFAFDLDLHVPFVKPDLVAEDTNGDVVERRKLPPVGTALSVGPVFQFR